MPRPKALVRVTMPAGLSGGQAEVWRQIAPLAAAKGTLTADTVFAFRELCALVVFRDQMVAQIAQDGLTTTAVKTRMEQDGSGDQVAESKAHPLITKALTAWRSIQGELARYGLNAMGKPMVEPARPVADPLASLIPMRRVR